MGCAGERSVERTGESAEPSGDSGDDELRACHVVAECGHLLLIIADALEQSAEARASEAEKTQVGDDCGTGGEGEELIGARQVQVVGGQRKIWQRDTDDSVRSSREVIANGGP